MTIQKAVLGVSLAVLVQPGHLAMAQSHRPDLHVYRSYSNFGPPGMYLPDGPDAVVRATLVCPGAKTPGVRIVLPAGSSTARYVVPAVHGPLYQPISLSLRQDYAQGPDRILFRLHYDYVAVDGYLGFSRAVQVSFAAADCDKPWHLRISAKRLSDIYRSGSLSRYGSFLVPFPDER